MRKIFFKNLELKISDNIYETGEDSELLANNMEIEDNEKVLDIGTGSGVMALIASKNAKYVLGVDINRKAIEISKSNAYNNKIKNVEFKKSDLFEKINKKYDVILFNPPYLPTEEEDRIWSGGKNGRKIIERFSKEFKEYLKEDGKVYMVISSLTGKEEVEKIFKNEGMNVYTKGEKKIPWEILYVLKITK
ncbi:MAG: HemK2/MTQ2 family protein methyltransferase [Candidatus Aenigmatarchaeota archaeon]